MPVPVSDKDRHLMRTIDEIHLELPHFGSRGMKNELRTRGHKTGRTHVRTLMRKMGMEAIYRKPRLSKPHPEHKVYPYLLKGLSITSANHVWCSDITYIPMAWGKSSTIVISIPASSSASLVSMPIRPPPMTTAFF
ncbi:MAG TPA: IS3 family transposase [Syntrophorhabdaceae bacterium]|nr:IS3 family transposase [Syntrophorhabdaceae bacterium]